MNDITNIQHKMTKKFLYNQHCIIIIDDMIVHIIIAIFNLKFLNFKHVINLIKIKNLNLIMNIKIHC